MASLHLMSTCIPIKLWNMVIIPSHSASWGQNDFITLREHSRLDPHNTPGAGGAFSCDCDIIAVTCQYSSSDTPEKTFHNSLFTIDCLFVGLSAVKLDICGSALLCLTWHSGKFTQVAVRGGQSCHWLHPGIRLPGGGSISGLWPGWGPPSGQVGDWAVSAVCPVTTS